MPGKALMSFIIIFNPDFGGLYTFWPIGIMACPCFLVVYTSFYRLQKAHPEHLLLSVEARAL